MRKTTNEASQPQSVVANTGGGISENILSLQLEQLSKKVGIITRGQVSVARQFLVL